MPIETKGITILLCVWENALKWWYGLLL